MNKLSSNNGILTLHDRKNLYVQTIDSLDIFWCDVITLEMLADSLQTVDVGFICKDYLLLFNTLDNSNQYLSVLQEYYFKILSS